MPDSTREIINFRLEQLPAASREVLEAASVAGMTFSTQVVAAAAARSCAEVEAECEHLARTALFLHTGTDIEWPDGSRGREQQFRHALYQQVLYNRVTPTRRQTLHRKVAERIESGHADQLTAVARQLSAHYEQAGDLARAVDWLETLVQQARARSAIVEVEALLQHAVLLQQRLPEGEPRRRRLLPLTIEHGVALASVRGAGAEQVQQVFEDARALAASVVIAPEEIAALGFAALTDILSGRLREACSLGEQQLVLAGPDAPSHLIFGAHVIVGMALLYLGEVGPALAQMESAFAARQAEAEDLPFVMPIYDPLVQLQMAFGLAQVVAGREQRGWDSVESGLQRARSTGMPAYLGPALSRAIGIAIVRRDLAAARAFATELLALCESNALPLWREAARVQLGWLDVTERRDPALIEPLRLAVDDFHSSGSLGRPRMFSMLADAYLLDGRVHEASEALDQAFDNRGQECLFDAELFRQRAAIIVAGGQRSQLTAAEHFLERATEVAETQGTRLFGLRATVDLCRLWNRAGKRREAQQRLQQTLAMLDEDFAPADVRIARDLIN